MSTNKLTFPSLLDNNSEGLRQAGGWTYNGDTISTNRHIWSAELP